MTITLNRLFRNDHETIGVLSLEDKLLCWILEDEKRTVKVFNETRIPSGVYNLGLRKSGTHHERYALKFPKMHKGMLQLENVPNFTSILIHIGNDDDDTAGCLLVGRMSYINSDNRYTLVNSTLAYQYIYPLIANPIANGEKSQIVIKDEIEAMYFPG